MSNFSFIKDHLGSFYEKAIKAEQRVHTEPVSSASYSRLILEEGIHRIYETEYLDYPFNKELSNLMAQESIKDILPSSILDGLHIVRKNGNNAVHYGKRVSSSDALVSLKYIYTFLKWFAGSYGDPNIVLPSHFDDSMVPKIGSQQRVIKDQQLEFEQLMANMRAQYEAEIDAKDKALKALQEESQEKALAFEKDKKEQRSNVATIRRLRKVKISSEFTEAETRKHIIDVALKEAGWFDLNKGHEVEYPVKGMPISPDNPNGNGFVDYVLWGDDGKPLALVEAKRTSKYLESGRHQAFLYANCLEQEFGRRPIIFYTNGYETKLWDDQFYSTPRRIYGFYTKDQLELLLQQRESRKDLRKATINSNIVNRPYQHEAIKRVAESFVVDSENGIRGNKRKALLVMATGSGKTRTAAALVDVFMKNNWVKRVLFLADRNALVNQAKNSFNEQLPNVSTIDLTKDPENDATRIVFSTYPTMMNKIDGAYKGDQRFYGVGHFDLIIIDEAHRSVYNRYQAIFEYFDAMIVGLTATPKDGIDHNTYELFECPNEDPTFMYELQDAVPQYLCDYVPFDVETEFSRNGIKYKDLSERDQRKYEETFRDKSTGILPDEIHKGALNKWLYNKDTAFKVLDALMQKGLKIEGGDKIGRTIIFAISQKHAQFIVDCFTERYPELPAGFVQMVHTDVSHAQSIIDAFCDHHNENLPQIAVSVDMMDTGIDAPRVLNLVFFKPVQSFAKFWQMIGRGTRKSPNVFGPGLDKDVFYIFDVCENFEFFDENKKGTESLQTLPISQQIFIARLELSRLLLETGEEEDRTFSSKLRDLLHSSIIHLDKNRFQVKMAFQYFEKYSDRNTWNNIGDQEAHEIEENLSHLPTPESINETARRFDLLMLKLQIATLMMTGTQKKYHNKLVNIADGLSSKYSIPEVLKNKGLIERMRDPDFYKHLNTHKLEEIREEIRELVHYLESNTRTVIYTNFEDSEANVSLRDKKTEFGYSGAIYRKRVESFVRENKHQLTISKLNTNTPITQDELKVLESILFDGTERGSKEDFKAEYGEEPLGKFIRGIIGLDISAAQKAFGEFLQAGDLSANQMTFLQTIINYLTQNGTIDPRMLTKPPFTDVDDRGIFGVFEEPYKRTKIVNIIQEINHNAEVG